MTYSATSRKLGFWSALTVLVLEAAYAAALAVGLLSLGSPEEPIGNPIFSILELLILAISPALIGLFAAVHAWAPPEGRVLTLTALVFAGLLAGVTCSVHFVILTLSSSPAFATLPALPLLLSFKWPSLVYALDILAWDLFFPLAALFAAPVFRGSRLAGGIRVLLIASGVMALAGLGGVAGGDMRIRNVGIVGYVVVFPVVAGLLALLFHRTRPATSAASRPEERRVGNGPLEAVDLEP